MTEKNSSNQDILSFQKSKVVGYKQRSLLDGDENTLLIPGGGYKLSSVEILNWGTFDKLVWKLDADGAGALITGENGSGKSTLVDALLTLLVANNKRNYNLSSGNGRRERSESTYVRGAYGKKQDTFGGTKIKYCRGENETYSVLIAQFKNDLYQDYLTMAQFFWLENGELKKFFITSMQAMSVAKHFSSFKTPQELKKNLKSLSHTKVHDNFSDYQQVFLNHFGPKSAKAMDLFNQVVAIKEIGPLSEFVRKHMLEEYNVEDLINQLFANYDNLSVAHSSILMARMQLDLLLPIGEMAKNLKNQQDRLDAWTLEERKIPLYFNTQRKKCLLDQIKKSEFELNKKESEQSKLWQELSSLNDQKNQILVSIKQNDSGQEVEKIQLQINQVLEKKKQRLLAYVEYEKLAQKLNLKVSPDLKSFHQNREKIKNDFESLKENVSRLEGEIYSSKKELDLVNEKIKLLTEDLETLKKTKGNIPTALMKLRDDLCEHLGAKRSELPFVAELLQVSDSEKKKWNNAIEKLLRSFGLRLLIPTELYNKVNKYLSKTSIGIKVIYNKVDFHQSQVSWGHPGPHSLFSKLEFHSRSPYSKWLKAQIAIDFDFLCTEELEVFQSNQRVLMPSGLIKRGPSLHEKDDRNYQGSILGWDNTAKLAEISEFYANAKSEENALSKKLQVLYARSLENKNSQLALRDFEKFNDFSTIDWEDCVKEDLKLKGHKEKLSSGSISLLQKDFEKLTKQLSSLQTARDQLLSEITLLKNDLSLWPKEMEQCEQVINSILDAFSFDMSEQDLFKETEKSLKKKNINFKTLKSESIFLLQKELMDEFQKDKGEMEQKIHHDSLMIIKKMTQFKIKFQEASLDLQAGMEYLPDYLKILENLEKESLPAHEKRFKTLLNKSIINDMAAFKSTLETAYDEISESVGELNESLKKIPYSPQTYVQLHLAKSKDLEIREFNNMLRNAMKIKSNENIDLEESFGQIKKILDKMKSDPAWCKEVTDVRNWADFFVLELNHEDHSQKNYYADSSGLSGGQKAKLAFTILASAIAFQYGLHKENAKEKSFRFVVIDEAFSKSDEKNSKYAMELFQQLGLQLFVVTPKDKIHIVEPFVKNIFLTKINDDLNHSQILKFKIEEFNKNA